VFLKTTSNHPTPSVWAVSGPRRWLSGPSAIGYGLVAPCLVILVLVVLYPMVYTLFLSFHQQILTRPWMGTPYVGLANYVGLAQDVLFQKALWQTTVFVVVSLAVEFAVGMGLALLLHEEFIGKNVTRGVVLLPWMLSPVVAAFTWAWMLNDSYGLVNYLLMQTGLIAEPWVWLGDEKLALKAIIAVDAWREIPFVALVLLAGLQSIPPKLYEAARIDGAGSWKAFLYVTLPLLKPSFLVALLMRTMIAIRIFDLVFIMTRGGPASSTEMLATFTYKEAFAKFGMGYAAAGSMVIMLISLAVSLFYIFSLRAERELRA
jgi:ABC-type sugar transport system permease subunit